MLRRWSLLLSVLAFATIVLYFAFSRDELPAGAALAAGDDGAACYLIRFGLTDTEPTNWDGSISIENGEVAALRNWRPRPTHQINGTTSWELSTDEGPNIGWRANMSPPSEDKPLFLWRPGLVVDVKETPATRVDVTTTSGRFSFRPSEVRFGSPARKLDGAVVIERIPRAEKLTGEDYQDDFVSMLSGSDGEVWVCWVAYRDNANEVLVRRYNGSSWEAAQKVTEQPGDVFLAKMGRDRNGRPWAVWSHQEDGNFDLYGRYLESGSWSAVERLTTNDGNDVFHNLATDADGNLWLVWQSVRGRQYDVYARRYDGSSWSPEEKVSPSSANDWEPVIAADGAGRVYVAWDTYDKGDYDVVMRSWAAGEWSGVSPVADTPRYEAHISLAVDGEDRLWAAWNESGTNWGKDTGWVLNVEGTRLYEWRSIEVVVWDGKSWHEPAADLKPVLPPGRQDPRGFTDFPILYPDGDGRIWLFFRNRTLRLRDNPGSYHAHRATWETWATTIDRNRWIPLVPIPFTRMRMDARYGLASDGEGNVFAAWPTDHRDYEEFLFQHADVYAARLPRLYGSSEPVKLVPRARREVAYIPFHPNDAEDVARIRSYTIESGGKTYRIYRGDTHRHTEISMDGNNDGSIVQTYRYAIDAAELEYLLTSDHNQHQGPDVPYINWVLQQFVDVMTIPGRFVPYYGYERSTRYPNGHRNILFTKRGNPTLPMPEAERFGEKVGAEELYAYLREYGGICISHTSATNMGTDWSFPIDAELEPLVEIYQGDRISSEYEGAPRAAVAGNPYTQPGLFRPKGYIWNAWAKGIKLGVQAASDHVSTHISYACTLAEEFSREGMIDAMKKRHSYGATDNIILDYRLQAGGKEYLQGDIVEVSGDFNLWVKIIGTAPIRQIDIIKNQTFLHNRQNLGQEVSFTFVDNDPGSGENYYYVRVIQKDGQIAWSSPIWVTGG